MNQIKKISLGFCFALFMLSGGMSAQSIQSTSETPDFKVFPNPNLSEADTYVSLQGFQADNLLVIVYDMLGREIYSKIELIENEGFLFTISSDGHRLTSGVYLITASANDKVFHQKLIVK
jgi:type IX secretion system substrate protein